MSWLQILSAISLVVWFVLCYIGALAIYREARRDYLAAKALPALITGCGNGVSFGPDSTETNLKFSKVAYCMADAMLEARALGKEPS